MHPPGTAAVVWRSKCEEKWEGAVLCRELLPVWQAGLCCWEMAAERQEHGCSRPAGETL